MKRCLCLFLLVLMSAAWAFADTQTLPEFNGTGSYNDPGPFPTYLVGTFDILPGTTSAMISGTFGNSTVGSSSGVDLYLGSVLVGQCIEFATCYQSGAPWSYTLTSADLSALGTGVVDFTAMQTSQYTVRLGVTTLVTNATATPEPASMMLLASGLLGLAGIKRKRA